MYILFALQNVNLVLSRHPEYNMIKIHRLELLLITNQGVGNIIFIIL
jgi:hypothetical protein